MKKLLMFAISAALLLGLTACINYPNDNPAYITIPGETAHLF